MASKLNKTIIFKVDEDLHKKINDKSVKEGFNSVSTYVRVQLTKAMNNEI